jgi:hypothetical protein
VRALKLQNRGL